MTSDSEVGPEGDQFELAFDLGKPMMVNAILIAQDQFNGFSHRHTDKNQYFQNFNLFIGDSIDWNKNQRCPGGPFMKTDAGSDGWYWDERIRPIENPRNPGYVWTYGKEAWCNLEGQYVHIVADLSHLEDPYLMSLCSVGIMGASYTRDEPLPSFIELP